MKATGIVRRIDDLGRIVIPKEIRRKLGIKEGNPLDFFLHADGVFLKKYEVGPSFSEKISTVLLQSGLIDYAPTEEIAEKVDELADLIAKFEEMGY